MAFRALREWGGGDQVVAIVTLVLSAATTGGIAYLGHRFGLVHFHLIGGIPLGAALIGAGAATGAALAIRLSANYDTAAFRLFGQATGLAAYAAVVVLDYLTLRLTVGPRTFMAPQLMDLMRYLQLLAEQGAAAMIAQLPQWVRFPPQVTVWIGILRLIVEVVATVVATGWTISLLADVPFCWRNRRFFELRFLVESANIAAVQEWEQAINQRRPIEARAILARVRGGKVIPRDRSWMRIAVHQCPVCLVSRVRIERRRRAIGFVQTEPSEEMQLDAVQGSALLAT